MEQHWKMHGNKPRGKLDLNLESVFGSVITLEIDVSEGYVKTRKSVHGIKPTYYYYYYKLAQTL